ncbi:MAG: arsenate reductase ArsC [Alphaproteobacteria bacterium]
MPAMPLNVLFLCTGNSCRSIMAQSILDHLGAGRFKGHSAGSHPAGRVNPYSLAQIEQRGCPTAHLRSKNWDEFGGAHAPAMDVVITVCDNAAGEVCPVWPGHPLTAHWPFRDPAAFTGTDAETHAEYAAVYSQIEARVRQLVALPFEAKDLKQQLAAIGAGGVL